MFRSFFIIALIFFIPFCKIDAIAQSENGIEQASLYLEKRTTDLYKFINRSNRIQERLLRRLKKKEARLLQKLAAKDSALYRQYAALPLTYDSIATLSQDTAALAAQGKRRNGTIDSLKGIQQFISNQGGKLSTLGNTGKPSFSGTDYTAKLSELQSKLNAEQQIKELIGQRTRSLEQLGAKAGIPGLHGIQKDVYYAQEKIKAWRALADDPDAAEEKAMEYLQGIDGFDNFLNKNNGGFGGLKDDASSADLQAMGYQTKEQLKGMLSEKFGNLQSVQQSMGSQVQQFSEKLKDVTGKVNEGKQAVGEARATKDQLKHIEKPAFKKNPERGKPFWQRLENQYNFQTQRATPDGLRPATLELGASVAFKHTPKLSYGIGIATSIGLGQDWQNIHLSYEGFSARAYADWLLLYGFSAQAGYERAFRPTGRAYVQQDTIGSTQPTTSGNALQQAFGGQQQTAYIGIMKRYRINSKWSGTFLAAYNILWQQSNFRTPFMIRFGWNK